MDLEKGRVLSFSICANGDFLIDVAEGHELVAEHIGSNQLRVSAHPNIFQSDTPSSDDRSASFKEAAEIGQLMEDGSIYAGVSPIDGRSLYVAGPEHFQSGALRKTREVVNSEMHGRTGWKVANIPEFLQIMQHRTRGESASIISGNRKYYRVTDENGKLISVDTAGNLDRNPRSSLPFFSVILNN